MCFSQFTVLLLQHSYLMIFRNEKWLELVDFLLKTFLYCWTRLFVLHTVPLQFFEFLFVHLGCCFYLILELSPDLGQEDRLLLRNLLFLLLFLEEGTNSSDQLFATFQFTLQKVDFPDHHYLCVLNPVLLVFTYLTYNYLFPLHFWFFCLAFLILFSNITMSLGSLSYLVVRRLAVLPQIRSFFSGRIHRHYIFLRLYSLIKVWVPLCLPHGAAFDSALEVLELLIKFINAGPRASLAGHGQLHWVVESGSHGCLVWDC